MAALERGKPYFGLFETLESSCIDGFVQRCRKPMRGDLQETAGQGSRGEFLERGKGQERIGRRNWVTPFRCERWFWMH
jgi:hypothetical protein